MKNNRVLLAIAFVILFVVFNIIVFILSPNMTATFWTAYNFTIVAFLVQVVSFFISFQRKASKNSAFYGLSLTVISAMYFIIQLVVGIVFMALSWIDLKIAIIVEIIILSVFLIVALIALIGKNIVTDKEIYDRDKTISIGLMENEIASLKEKTSNTALLNQLDELLELIHYSEPNSNTALALIEQKIIRRIDNLADYLEHDNEVIASEIIVDIKELLADRNRKCRILK